MGAKAGFLPSVDSKKLVWVLYLSTAKATCRHRNRFYIASWRSIALSFKIRIHWYDRFIIFAWNGKSWIHIMVNTLNLSREDNLSPYSLILWAHRQLRCDQTKSFASFFSSHLLPLYIVSVYKYRIGKHVYKLMLHIVQNILICFVQYVNNCDCVTLMILPCLFHDRHYPHLYV